MTTIEQRKDECKNLLNAMFNKSEHEKIIEHITKRTVKSGFETIEKSGYKSLDDIKDYLTVSKIYQHLKVWFIRDGLDWDEYVKTGKVTEYIPKKFIIVGDGDRRKFVYTARNDNKGRR